MHPLKSRRPTHVDCPSSARASRPVRRRLPLRESEECQEHGPPYRHRNTRCDDLRTLPSRSELPLHRSRAPPGRIDPPIKPSEPSPRGLHTRVRPSEPFLGGINTPSAVFRAASSRYDTPFCPSRAFLGPRDPLANRFGELRTRIDPPSERFGAIRARIDPPSVWFEPSRARIDPPRGWFRRSRCGSPPTEGLRRPSAPRRFQPRLHPRGGRRASRRAAGPRRGGGRSPRRAWRARRP